MLATGPHAALRADRAHVGALFESEKHFLELHHAGIGEQQRRVIRRHQRAGRHDRMAVAVEKVEETLADFAAFHGGIGKITLNIFLTAKSAKVLAG